MKVKEIFIQAISSDSKTKHGYSMLDCIIFDELTHTTSNRDLWDTLLTTSTGARRQSLYVLAITTAGFDKNSICYGKFIIMRNKFKIN